MKSMHYKATYGGHPVFNAVQSEVVEMMLQRITGGNGTYKILPEEKQGEKKTVNVLRLPETLLPADAIILLTIEETEQEPPFKATPINSKSGTAPELLNWFSSLEGLANPQIIAGVGTFDGLSSLQD